MKIGLHIADFTFPAGAPGLADDLTRIAAEAGELGIEVLRAAKERLDPAGIMNPWKLLP